MTALRRRANPLLPDMDGYNGGIEPHPDGRAWLKACSVCALRRHDPQELGDRYQQSIAAGKPGMFFYCVHRLTDDDHFRICACYAALHSL